MSEFDPFDWDRWKLSAMTLGLALSGYAFVRTMFWLLAWGVR